MLVHPAIAALRGTPTSQRQAGSVTAPCALKTARDAWFAQPQVVAVASDLARYGAGDPLESCAALRDSLRDPCASHALAGPLLRGTIEALSARPLGEAPFRFKVSQGLATLQILEAGRATLSLAAYEPLAKVETPDTALFSDRDVHEIALAGEASGVVHTCKGEGDVSSRPVHWRAGTTLALKAQTQARQVLRVERSLLLLQLSREAARPAPTRLVALDTGESVRTASGDKSASQAVMALGVLGALGQQSAIGVMARTALNREEDSDLRWEAARQILGLDAKKGLDLLNRLTAGKSDPLAGPAKALKAQLLAAQPELRALLDGELALCL